MPKNDYKSVYKTCWKLTLLVIAVITAMFAVSVAAAWELNQVCINHFQTQLFAPSEFKDYMLSIGLVTLVVLYTPLATIAIGYYYKYRKAEDNA